MPGTVVHQEGIAVGAEYEGHTQGFRIVERLLYTSADAVGVVLGLNDGNGDIGLEVQDIVRPLLLTA